MRTLLLPLLLLLTPDLYPVDGGGFSLSSSKGFLECASQILYMDQDAYQLPTNYSRNIPPDKNTTVYIGINVNRVSGVDENREEITLDVFLQVSWEDMRLNVPFNKSHIDLPWEFRQLIWMPDLYIWQLQTMKILSVLQEMASLRLYANHTVSVSIGATITIKCEMDFVLYPLDVQNCAIDFSSYKYTREDVRFVWREVAPWSGISGEQRREFRLPKYVVTFVTDKSNHIRNFGEGEHSAARLQIKLSRELRGYLLESYLPSSLFVIISWGSFCVIPEIVPGRMVLLVTTLLSLVTMFDTVSTNSPDALELKCIEVWLISCTIFVFLALLEYFVVLFGIRYDKSWSRRRQDLRRAASAAQLAPPPLHINHSQRLSTPVTGTPQGGVFSPQLSVEDEGLKQQFSHQTIQRLTSSERRLRRDNKVGCETRTISKDSPILEMPGDASDSFLSRFATKVDHGVMFCGAQHGALDRYALMVFPLCFLLFTIIYWTTYLSEAHKAMHD
ncbi:glycine receptor subunit alpha-4-like isoform X1 [Bicyclus anynana]|uniref:Glycine receptor subunit alpha-4-like isoform X3 n=2 Tax=Bicyclus anynana TaxID=110368 RepID=A0A1C9EGL6_BICAN|nr:glycine receptor subunit alpha-4-like isoform X1 [Bicyclus anynana]AON96640.1 putative glycine receptor beta precursor [Bicyclus anynana]